MQQIAAGTLYVVATPIGNLADLTPRAVDVLGQVDLVLAEDTRHTAQLLRHCGLSKPLQSLHEHNERQKLDSIVQRLQAGESLALVSDAGTPLLSDPGFPLVRRLRELDMPVIPIPGPCAAVAALSVAGLATDRFAFEGFLPARSGARRTRLEGLADETRTLVFYESGKRLAGVLNDMCEILGPDREAAVARELTKLYESIYRGSLAQLRDRAGSDVDMVRGELVLLVQGTPVAEIAENPELDRVLGVLLPELPLSQAVKLAVELCGLRRNEVYRRATELQKGTDLP
ncbi:MAG: 16S rRNA (cytidine(1402)-2'-O)-methyltransferase [Chromatiales bacterium]|nr:16S rRNA (cytidine(1402)-2'-O)-methyltransferase [Chromatiales bacterium]